MMRSGSGWPLVYRCCEISSISSVCATSSSVAPSAARSASSERTASRSSIRPP